MNSNSPKVTIGIPCFNAERWLAQCLESALNQSWPNTEVIVVDNGSTDRSPEIIRDFKHKIRFVAISRRGANFARNEILRKSTGEWIQFLDADDYLLPDKISSQLKESKDAPLTGEGQGLSPVPDVIYSPIRIEEHGKCSIGEIELKLDIPAQWISWQLPQTGACLWRKSTLARLGGWNESMPCCQEHELYLRAIQAGVHFQFTPTPNAVYRIWSDETLCRKDPLLVIDVRTELIEQMLSWLQDNQLLNHSHRTVAGRAFFEMARTAARFDLQLATHYLKEKQSRGLLKLEGPAAPWAYRICFQLFGFKTAERIASLLRPK